MNILREWSEQSSKFHHNCHAQCFTPKEPSSGNTPLKTLSTRSCKEYLQWCTYNYLCLIYSCNLWLRDWLFKSRIPETHPDWMFIGNLEMCAGFNTCISVLCIHCKYVHHVRVCIRRVCLTCISITFELTRALLLVGVAHALGQSAMCKGWQNVRWKSSRKWVRFLVRSFLKTAMHFLCLNSYCSLSYSSTSPWTSQGGGCILALCLRFHFVLVS